MPHPAPLRSNMRGRCGGISVLCVLACYSQNYSLPLVHDLGALCFRSIANAIWTNKPPTTTLWALGALGNPTYAPHWVGLPRRNLELEQSSYFPDTPDRRSLGHIPLPPLRRTPPRTRKGSSRSSLRVVHTHHQAFVPTIPSHTLPESPPEVSQGCSPTITHIPRGHLVYPLDTTLTQLQL